MSYDRLLNSNVDDGQIKTLNDCACMFIMTKIVDKFLNNQKQPLAYRLTLLLCIALIVVPLGVGSINYSFNVQVTKALDPPKKSNYGSSYVDVKFPRIWR